ncbi:hypothetical protein IWX90DRAFT_109043 [Phyllosticta citrichinensis]|uniref:Uncharacterized protein n=1 Tax=Phyllosticta citrichinensis TaxID=1130410 RepID=A0ABR1Y2Q1_9PEZI
MQSPKAGLQMLQPGRAPGDPARRAGFVATLACSFGWPSLAQVHAARQSRACILRLDPVDRGSKPPTDPTGTEEEGVSRASTPKLCMRHLHPQTAVQLLSPCLACARVRLLLLLLALHLRSTTTTTCLWLRACHDTLRSAEDRVKSGPPELQASLPAMELVVFAFDLPNPVTLSV